MQIADSPLYLFVKGPMDLNSQRFVAMIGTRKNTLYGTQMTEQLVAGLKKYNVNIISGLAYGIDGIAHAKANATRSPNCAVLAHGLDTIYPKKHYSLAQEIINTGGVLVTEHLSKTPMHPDLFPRRNRIVAGISKATIIVESAAKGGSLVTADIANSYDKDVFAVPGRTTDIYSKGCNNLIKNNQANLLTSAKDIVKMLNWDLNEKSKIIQKQLFVELNENEQKIYDLLHEKGQQLLDVISLECNIPMYQLSAILLQMELRGITKPLPGKMFELI